MDARTGDVVGECWSTMLHSRAGGAGYGLLLERCPATPRSTLGTDARSFLEWWVSTGDPSPSTLMTPRRMRDNDDAIHSPTSKEFSTRRLRWKRIHARCAVLCCVPCCVQKTALLSRLVGRWSHRVGAPITTIGSPTTPASFARKSSVEPLGRAACRLELPSVRVSQG